MVAKRKRIAGQERKTPQTKTFYMTDSRYENLELMAEKLRKIGIPGLYNKRGTVNRSAVLGYIIDKFDNFLKKAVPDE